MARLDQAGLRSVLRQLSWHSRADVRLYAGVGLARPMLGVKGTLTLTHWESRLVQEHQ